MRGIAAAAHRTHHCTTPTTATSKAPAPLRYTSYTTTARAASALMGSHKNDRDGEPVVQPMQPLQLDQRGIVAMAQRLSLALEDTSRRKNGLRFRFDKHQGKLQEAAVLIALRKIDGRTHVVFEERNNRLNSHGGEVCFAGGKVDTTDASLEDAALRETHEEIGIPPHRVRVVGRLGPAPNYNFTIRVHPVVGVIEGDGSLGEFLRALEVNKQEVHRVFALPLEHFFDKRNVKMDEFRGTPVKIPSYSTDKPGLRIWGLTAFILNEFLTVVAPELLFPGKRAGARSESKL